MVSIWSIYADLVLSQSLLVQPKIPRGKATGCPMAPSFSIGLGGCTVRADGDKSSSHLAFTPIPMAHGLGWPSWRLRHCGCSCEKACCESGTRLAHLGLRNEAPHVLGAEGHIQSTSRPARLGARGCVAVAWSGGKPYPRLLRGSQPGQTSLLGPK